MFHTRILFLQYFNMLFTFATCTFHAFLLFYHRFCHFIITAVFTHLLISLSRHARHFDFFLYHTACQEHSYLTCTLSILFTLTRTLHCRSPFLLDFLLLAGDIKLNPGPTNFTVCTLNIRSLVHQLHSAAISDFIDSHNPDIFCLTAPG